MLLEWVSGSPGFWSDSLHSGPLGARHLTSIGLHSLVHKTRGLDLGTSEIFQGPVILFVSNSGKRNRQWLLEKLYPFPYQPSKQPCWTLPIQHPFGMDCVLSFPFDYTGFSGINSFLELSLTLLSDSFTDVTTHSLRYDTSFHSAKIVMSRNLN